MPTYQTSQIEEQPILGLKEILEDAALRSLQTESHTYQGMMRGRIWVVTAIMHDKKGIYEDLAIYGDCWFRWVCNRTGSDKVQGDLVKFYTKSTGDIDSGAVNRINKAGEWTADHEVGNMVYILDNNDSAGAAPEGESRYIVKNTAGILYVQYDFTVAPAADDDVEIRSNCMVVPAAIGDDKSEVAGVVISPDGIPNDYWGWIGVHGIFPALVKADTAITAGQRLIADTSRLNAGAGPSAFEDLGFAIVGCSADIVSDMIPVKLELPV